MREQVVPEDAMFYQTTSGAAHTQTMLGLAGGDGDVQAHDGNQKYEDALTCIYLHNFRLKHITHWPHLNWTHCLKEPLLPFNILRTFGAHKSVRLKGYGALCIRISNIPLFYVDVITYYCPNSHADLSNPC